MRPWRAGALATALLLAGGCGSAATEGAAPAAGDMILATTTSTRDSGLLDAILPEFQEETGCVPKTVAVGSGQAMAMGARGDADVLLVHSPEAEREFMSAGHGIDRRAVMHNDFVLVGPPADPVGLEAAEDAAAALRLIAADRAAFASRADGSGTHAKELGLWREAGIDPSGGWYLETGQGMGETLTIADQKSAYTLTDRGTAAAAGDLGSEIAFEGSSDLLNPYHVITVAADDGAGARCAEEFSRWIRSEPVQRAIADFGTDVHGRPLFVPDALD